MSETLQYIRRCNLIVSGDAEGLDLSALRIVFKVKKSDAQTPNTADVRVYNLSADTANRIQKEFSRVILQAGYESNYGVIFDGNIKQVITGRESGTDTYLDIFAGDGDVAYNGAVVNMTLAAGATQARQIAAAAGTMQGVQQGYIAETSDKPLPRGKVMYGMARHYLRRSAQTTGTTWSVQDGRLQFVQLGGTLPGQAVVLTAKTGLIGTPAQTNDGISARSLLNPMLRIGAKVKIDEASIQHARLPDTSEKATVNKPASIAADGVYRVLTVEHSGDTRGQDWYSDLVCLSVDETAPPGKQVKK